MMSTNGQPQNGEQHGLEEILVSYLEAVESGKNSSEQELYEKYPELAADLREYIEAERELLYRAGPTVEEESFLQASIDTSRIGTRTDTITNMKAVAGDCGEMRQIPSQFGRYQIQKVLGSGAMGTVYLAFDEKLERLVALKLPNEQLEVGSELATRFEREARAAAGLQHRNICSVHDVGDLNGMHYLAMSYVDGEPLSDAYDSNSLIDHRVVCELVIKLARALQVAHDNAVIHRDLKPANVMIDTEGEPVIMDFGLALQVDREDEVRVTQNGTIIGTPAYMSPEQIDGKVEQVGPASDMFSLGVIFYELLTRQLPFQGGLSTVIHRILCKTPAKPSDVADGIDPALDKICMKMLAKKPADRFGSMEELACSLEAVLRKDPCDSGSTQHFMNSNGSGILSRWWLGIAAVVMAIVSLGSWLSVIAYKTDFGTVEIEIPEGVEGIQVQLAQDGKPIRVLDPEAGWEFRVAEGLYEVRHTGDQDRFQIDHHSLTVTRDEVVRLRLTLKPKKRLKPLDALESIKTLNGPVNAVSLSPKRKWLIVAGIVDTRNGYIMICDSSGKPGQTIELPGRATGEHIAWFDDHRFAIGTSAGGVVIIDCNLSRIVDGVRTSGKARLEVATVPEKKLLAVSGESGNISIFDMIRGKLLVEQLELGQRCRAMEFARLSSGERILVAGGHSRIFVRNLSSGEQRAMRVAGTQIHDLRVLKEGKQALVATAAGTVELIDLANGKTVRKYLGHTSGVESISLSPDEKLVATGCIDGKVRFFEVETGRGLYEGVGTQGGTKHIAVDWPLGLVYAGGGSRVDASGEWVLADELAIARWQLPSEHLSRHSIPVFNSVLAEEDVAHAPPALQESTAIPAPFEQHMQQANQWLEELNVVQAIAELEAAIEISPDSLIPRGYLALLATGSSQEELAFTQLNIARHLELDSSLAQSSYIARAMLVAYPDSSLPPKWEFALAKLAENFPSDWHVQHTFGLWQLKLGKLDSASQVFDVASSVADGPWEQAATKLAQLKLAVARGQIDNWHRWRSAMPKLELEPKAMWWLSAYELGCLSSDLEKLEDHVHRISLRPQAAEGVKLVYDASQGMQSENGEYNINAAAINKDGSFVALAPNSADRLYLWEPATGLRQITPGGEIRALAFQAETDRLLIGRPAGHVDILDVNYARVLKTLPRIGKVNGLTAAPRGQRIAVAYGNARCAVWDTASKELTYQVLLPGSGWQLEFSRSGKYLAIGVEGQRLLIFDRQLEQQAMLESVSVARFTWLDDEQVCFGYAKTNKIAIYSVAEGQTTASIEVGQEPAVVLASTMSSKAVVSGHADGSIWASDVTNGEHRRVGKLPQIRFAHLSMSADGRYLLAAGRRQKRNDGGSCCVIFEMPVGFVTDPNKWIVDER